MYTVDWFIKKFEAIPEDRWCVGEFDIGDQHCAYGHCGRPNSPEAKALCHLFYKATIIDTNDGESLYYQQPTPKQRILAALYDIKKMQEGDTILGNKSIQYPDATKEILSSIHNPEVEVDVVREKVNN